MDGHVSRLAAEGGVVVSHAASRTNALARVVGAIVALALPVFAMVATLVLAWEFRNAPLTLFDGVLSPSGQPDLYPSKWLSIGHAVVPVVFLLTNLVNRRYGEHLAIAHVLVSWTAAVALALAIVYRVDPGLPVAGEVISTRVAGAFIGAMTIGQLAGVYVFDRTRGVVWWKAPLYSALTSSFIAMFLFYPSAYAGSEPFWANQMAIDAGTKALMSFALLLPYLALRPIVRPSGGLGGY